MRNLTYEELRREYALIIAARQDGPRALSEREKAISAELTRRDMAAMGSYALSNPEVQVHDEERE